MSKVNKYKNRGFTLVEVLICVGIVGIIAAISIPALLSSTSAKALEAQRKALHSRMAQAFAQMKNLNLYKSDENSAMDLMTAFSTTYKITNICQIGRLSQCGIPDIVYDYYSETALPHEFELTNANTLSQLNANIPISNWGDLDTNAIGFRTANGESILLYYNPNCKAKKETSHNLVYSVCVNMIYDLNGKNKAPNAYGEDIGYITVFYPSNSSVVAPLINNQKSYTGKFSEMLSTSTSEDMVPATLEELTSILINQNLTKVTSEAGSNGLHWSSSYAESTENPEAWIAGVADGVKTELTSSTSSYRYYLLKK